jgi:hypothetical protein
MAARHEGHFDEALKILSRPPGRPGAAPSRRTVRTVKESKVVRPARKPAKTPAKPPPIPPSIPSPVKAAEAEIEETVEQVEIIESEEKVERVESAESTIEPIEERLLQGELLYLGERREEAKKIFDQVLEDRPGDSEIQQWADRAGGKSLETEKPAEAEEKEEEVALDIKSVSEELFAHKLTSFDVQRIFEEHFVGKNVAWSGKLRAVEKFSTDFVFGTTSGIKATFDIYELPASLYGERNVLAFVKFTEELADRLKDLKGTSVAFKGQLFKVDGFMRNLFITDGRLD